MMQDLATTSMSDIGCCRDQSQRKLASFIMFFEGSGYSRFSCGGGGGDNLIVSQVFDNDCNSIDSDSSTRRNSDFVLLRSQKTTTSPSVNCCSRRGEENLTSATPLATSTIRHRPPRETPTMTTAVELSVTRPKPAPRRSLANQTAAVAKSCLQQSSTESVNENSGDLSRAISSARAGLVLTNRVATLKRELFSSHSIAATAPKFQKIVTAAMTNHQRNHENQKELSLMNQPEFKTIQKLCSSPAVSTSLHQKPSDHRKLVMPISELRAPKTRDTHQVTAAVTANPDEEEADGGAQDVSTEDDEGATTEDSTDNKLSSKPKPGKLDLRQFDNITTAIGKLTVTPASSASPTPLVGSPSIATSAPANKSSSAAFKKQQTENQAPSGRRINNLRQNHGRAVAPPKLPSNLLFKNHSSLSRHTNEPTTSQSNSKSKLNNNDQPESAIDFSQSPIAQRLLKHSKDHKVSELNSPYESDSEAQHCGNHQHDLRGTIASPSDETRAGRNLPLEPSELKTTRGETMRQLNEILAKKPPGHPGAIKSRLNKGSSNDQLDDPKTLQQQQQQHQSTATKKDEKEGKKDKKKLRSDEKLEKRKLKEEERLRRQEEEKQRRQEKKLASKKSKSNSLNCNSIGEDGVPLFIKRCIEFIEAEGLDAEGLYRVPGNRAHVDAFVQKFKDNPEMSILESDVPVNAVATALKDFLSKKWGPIIPLNQMNELTELSSIPDKDQRVEAVKELIHKLPLANYKLLKYVFAHFVKVSHNNTLNSMDSKNLAICWWPTLLPLHFDDMIMFERMRPHLEESIQTMIDQYNFIFDDKQPTALTLT